jgi:hypothetical protein
VLFNCLAPAASLLQRCATSFLCVFRAPLRLLLRLLPPLMKIRPIFRLLLPPPPHSPPPPPPPLPRPLRLPLPLRFRRLDTKGARARAEVRGGPGMGRGGGSGAGPAMYRPSHFIG